MPQHVSNIVQLNVGKAPPIGMPEHLAPTHNQTLNGELWQSRKEKHPTTV